MKKKFTIGAAADNDILIKAKNSSLHQAEIIYNRGHWHLSNLVKQNPIYVNDRVLTNTVRLYKYDIIKISGNHIYWRDYFYEG